jgi:DNA-binding NarL/FixJ family response regulator
VRVAIADDALLVREGLARILTDRGIEVSASVGDVAGLLRAVAAAPPDVAILDLRMPPGFTDEGIRAAQRLAESHPELAVLILSQYREPSYAATLLAASGTRRGYLLKDSVLHADQLVGALYRLAAGGTVVDPAVIDTALRAASRTDRLRFLSPRELEVLRLLAQGFTDRGICEELVLSPHTVAAHVQHIFTKLDLPDSEYANRRVHAVLTYLEAVSPERS